MNWVLKLVLLGAVLVMAFFAFNSYLYEEKQSDVKPLADGEYFGHIHAITDNSTALDFDDVKWLTGEEGITAALNAGLCTEETREECLPNDFIITNDVEEDVRVALDARVSIVMQTLVMEETGEIGPRTISLEEFTALINDEASQWSNLPYEITLTNGAITLIEEVYVP